MSLIQTVVAMVRERGSATVDDLAPLIPTHTRAQVLNALQNGQREGWLSSKQGKGFGPGKGKGPGCYSPAVGVRDGWMPVSQLVLEAVEDIGRECTAAEVFCRIKERMNPIGGVSRVERSLRYVASCGRICRTEAGKFAPQSDDWNEPARARSQGIRVASVFDLGRAMTAQDANFLRSA